MLDFSCTLEDANSIVLIHKLPAITDDGLLLEPMCSTNKSRTTVKINMPYREIPSPAAQNGRMHGIIGGTVPEIMVFVRCTWCSTTH